MNEQQRRSEERFRKELLEMQNQSGYLRAKNQDVKNHIDELRRRIATYREELQLCKPDGLNKSKKPDID